MRRILRKEYIRRRTIVVPMYKRSMFVLLALALLAAAGLFYGYSQQGTELPLDEGRADGPAAKITVYVSGAVNRPGLVELSQGARAADAVNVCGGLLPTADEKAVNMAQVLKDGAQLQVPVKGAAGAGGSGKDSSGRVSINTADEKALDTLPGIGPAMARRIVEYRQSNGGFQSLEDLKKVKGIGAAKFEKLKDKVCL